MEPKGEGGKGGGGGKGPGGGGLEGGKGPWRRGLPRIGTSFQKVFCHVVAGMMRGYKDIELNSRGEPFPINLFFFLFSFFSFFSLFLSLISFLFLLFCFPL